MQIHRAVERDYPARRSQPGARIRQRGVNLQDDGRVTAQIGGHLAGLRLRDAELFKDHAGAGLLLRSRPATRLHGGSRGAQVLAKCLIFSRQQIDAIRQSELRFKLADYSKASRMTTPVPRESDS